MMISNLNKVLLECIVLVECSSLNDSEVLSL